MKDMGGEKLSDMARNMDRDQMKDIRSEKLIALPTIILWEQMKVMGGANVERAYIRVCGSFFIGSEISQTTKLV